MSTSDGKILTVTGETAGRTASIIKSLQNQNLRDSQTTNKVNYLTNAMTVTFKGNMNYKPDTFKINTNEFVNNFQMQSKTKEFIAPPNTSNEHHTSFQQAMKLIILIGQVFGLNPVLGVTENDAYKLKFTFYSGRCLYSMLSIIGQIIITFLCGLEIFRSTNESFSSSTSVVFYASNCAVTMLFLRVAIKWPKLCRQIAKIEAVDPNMDKCLLWKCNVTCIVVFSFAAVEHSLADFSDMSVAISCQPEENHIDALFLKNYYWVWSVVPYNTLFGLITKFINLQCTFNWNYSDAFIMCLCLYLTARLQQINDRLYAARGKIVPSSFWRTMREDYTKTTNLVRRVDDIVSGIIFISFASNLFSICLIILHTLEKGLKPSMFCDVAPSNSALKGYEHALYFIFSLTFLILRSLAMSLIAAKVNSASDKPAFALYDVHSDCFDVEVQRFIDQVHGDSVGLSGLKFFSVKRGIVLTIAATIVTYELVLIQFAGVNPSTKD